ncbi:hypothetical protein AB0L26_24160 [Streptomyces nondiastaticus]|uniref:hypothetical protein n=1 Tax=Streptomyces nondiastaticus TaxID=3154512 RepID=UPI00342BA9AB
MSTAPTSARTPAGNAESAENDVWRLLRGDTLVGTITVNDADLPWLVGRFAAEPAFEEVRPWFDEVLALLAADDLDRFDAVYDPIAEALTLVSPTGPVSEFLLYVEGVEARFRY